MGVLVFFVPVLLVVVLGYAVGYAVWEATGLGGNPEVFGWFTGLALLVAVGWLLLSRRARQRRVVRRARGRGTTWTLPGSGRKSPGGAGTWADERTRVVERRWLTAPPLPCTVPTVGKRSQALHMTCVT